jgi:hypothetical protein
MWMEQQQYQEIQERQVLTCGRDLGSGSIMARKQQTAHSMECIQAEQEKLIL